MTPEVAEVLDCLERIKPGDVYEQLYILERVALRERSARNLFLPFPVRLTNLGHRLRRPKQLQNRKNQAQVAIVGQHSVPLAKRKQRQRRQRETIGLIASLRRFLRTIERTLAPNLAVPAAT
jgi:hypothetical protein